MITIESLVEQGANVKLEVTPADLKMFAEAIVQRTIMAQQEERDAAMKREAEETWLNTKQVRELLNVCEGTLNLWAKRGYLVPVKVGNKNMYARSDVRRDGAGRLALFIDPLRAAHGIVQGEFPHQRCCGIVTFDGEQLGSGRAKRTNLFAQKRAVQHVAQQKRSVHAEDERAFISVIKQAACAAAQ